MGSHPHALPRARRLAAPISAVAVVALAAIALGTGIADGARVTVLGAAAPARPSCPNVDGRCIVEVRVTAFQTRIGKIKKPFLSRVRGKVVAWSIKLGRPSDEDLNCLNNGCTISDDDPDTEDARFPGFGQAAARIAVLKPVRRLIKRGRPVYRLVRQSPVELLTPFLGTTTTFTLRKPLWVTKRQIVALTVPTWAPMFVTGLGTKAVWRASRNPTKKRGGCINKNDPNNPADDSANPRAGAPHLKVGQRRTYKCVYSTNRLLYSATVVRAPVKQ